MPLSDNIPALVVSMLSFLVASASLGISIRSCSTSERLAHLSVEPEVRLYVEGKPRMGTIHVYNPGPIKVSSLSVSRFIVLVPYAGSPYSGVLSMVSPSMRIHWGSCGNSPRLWSRDSRLVESSPTKAIRTKVPNESLYISMMSRTIDSQT